MFERESGKLNLKKNKKQWEIMKIMKKAGMKAENKKGIWNKIYKSK
jgi:hypothetical protein